MQGRPTSEENWETAAVIDERVRQLARQGVSDPVLVNRVLGYMPALHRLYASATDAELAALAAVYPGFVRYARLMEDMSEAMRTGVGVLPGVTGFPLAQEPLKGLLEGMLASGATLEQQLPAGTPLSPLDIRASRVSRARRKIHSSPPRPEHDRSGIERNGRPDRKLACGRGAGMTMFGGGVSTSFRCEAWPLFDDDGSGGGSET
jgi:hypothetical protein